MVSLRGLERLAVRGLAANASAKNKICLRCLGRLELPKSLKFLSLSWVSQVTKNLKIKMAQNGVIG